MMLRIDQDSGKLMCDVGQKDIRAMSPFSRPDWRWTAAQQMLFLRQRAGRWEDKLIIEALRFLKRGSAADPTSGDRPSSALPNAHSIYLSGGVVKDELEARLLSGETFELIAVKTGLAISVIQIFEQLFFNVRDALNAFDWLMSDVVTINVGEPVTEGLVWKYIALAHGPILLDVMVDDYFGRPDPAIKQRSEWAAKGRFIVRELATDWASAKCVRSLFREGRQLFPHIYGGRRRRGQDQLLAIHRDIIALAQECPITQEPTELFRKPVTNSPRQKPRKDRSHGRQREREGCPVALTA